MTYDLLIRNGRIVDGAGNPWYLGDLAVRRGKIARITRRIVDDAKATVDASGLVVCPGFIDAHSHGDHNTLVYREMENVTHQGITTVVAGQCGSSPAPLSDKNRAQAQRQVDASLPEGYALELTWSTFDEYLREEEKKGLGANVAHMAGHGAIRGAGMGLEARDPTAAELEAMKLMTAEAMEAGAYGLSTGLIYPPGIYAKTSEIIELAKVAAATVTGLFVYCRALSMLHSIAAPAPSPVAQIMYNLRGSTTMADCRTSSTVKTFWYPSIRHFHDIACGHC